MEKLIAYCGLNCAECEAYIATKNDDQSLREKTAADWKKVHNYEGSPETINCSSCKGDGVKFAHCSQCEIRKCASAKGVENCSLCTEFKTCKTINDFLGWLKNSDRKSHF